MKSGVKTLLRAVAFCVVVAVVLSCLGSFFQPVWLKWNNFNTTKGFYEEPKNTIETVFLGSSVVASSISPIEMYDEYGINAYNLGMAQQPLLCSYYWLEEAYRCHSESLKTVVLEASSLRSDAGESFYHRAFDNMRFSQVKLRAVYDYMDGDIGRTFSFINPLVSYHSRWKTLEKADFDKLSYDLDNGTRGYYLIETSFANKSYYKAENIKNPVLDTEAKPKNLLEDATEYFGKMVEFCEEKGLNLIVMKAAANNWNDKLHNAVQELADGYGVDFLDFNYDPLFNLGGTYIHDYDTNDGKHLNYFGSVKLSKWMGEYLVENYGATDVRDNPRYDFMKAQSEEYEIRVRQEINLISSLSLKEYLEIAVSSDNTVLISAKEDAAAGLTDSDRAFLKGIGLDALSEISDKDSYIGIVSGNVADESVKVQSDNKDEEPLVVKGRFADGNSYEITSGGKNHGNVAEISINGNLQDDMGRGLNIVVYSNELGEVIGSATFDTHVSSSRDCYGLKTAYMLLNEESLMKEYDAESVMGRIVRYKKTVDTYREKAAS